ncbi:MAG: PilZ domain-containing protein [Planctomycetes bacterium]|nr:PilZ domain-containing protein [Planctomycetota bacterium]
MAKCRACGREFIETPSAGLENPETGHLQALCPACRAETRSAMDFFDKSEVMSNQTPFTSAETAAFKAMRRSLQELAKEERIILEPLETQPETYLKRNFPRFQVKFELIFSFLRDKRIFKGEVSDISQTGLCFITEAEVQEGQILSTVITTNEKIAIINRKENLLEVRRVIKTGDGNFMVGGRFIKGISVDKENRRKHHRRALSVPIFYRHPASDFIFKGMAMDISKSGLKMNCMGSFKVDEEYLVMLRTYPPTFMECDLRGSVKVVRVYPRPRGRCEIGCSFLRLKVSPLSGREEAG